jgi:hypothetical protein
MFYNYEIFKQNAFNFDISNGIFVRTDICRLLDVFLGSKGASYVKIFAAKKIYFNAFA